MLRADSIRLPYLVLDELERVNVVTQTLLEQPGQPSATHAW